MKNPTRSSDHFQELFAHAGDGFNPAEAFDTNLDYTQERADKRLFLGVLDVGAFATLVANPTRAKRWEDKFQAWAERRQQKKAARAERRADRKARKAAEYAPLETLLHEGNEELELAALQQTTPTHEQFTVGIDDEPAAPQTPAEAPRIPSPRTAPGEQPLAPVIPLRIRETEGLYRSNNVGDEDMAAIVSLAAARARRRLERAEPTVELTENGATKVVGRHRAVDDENVRAA